jgi:thioredoxin reductase
MYTHNGVRGMAMPDKWDVVVVGAGPAGLSAALVLGRCRRRVLLCDRGTPRSWASKAMYGFITRDGIDPEDFRELALQELARYRNVSMWRGEVTDAERSAEGFSVQLDQRVECRKLLVATGLMDQLPDIAGIENCFGVSVFQCPYCDGWEMRDKAVAIYGRRRRGFEMARALLSWTSDIVLCTDGPSGFGEDEARHLADNGIRVTQDRVAGLASESGQLTHVVFSNGKRLQRQALFFDTPSRAQSKLTENLGCRFNRHGSVLCGKYEATSVPGMYVAGNITGNVQLSIVAAGEGASAAFGINRALTREDFERRSSGVKRIEHTGPPLDATTAPIA